MAKGIPTLKRRPRRASGVVGRRTDRELLLKLMVEMNHIAQDVFRNWGSRPRSSARRPCGTKDQEAIAAECPIDGSDQWGRGRPVHVAS